MGRKGNPFVRLRGLQWRGVCCANPNCQAASSGSARLATIEVAGQLHTS
jgi:hypothetical protein